MTIVRILAVLAVLGVPAVLAPFLVRAGGQVSERLWTFCAAIICVIPLAAPWLLIGVVSPLSVWLVAIAGGIVMLKAIDWLARPRREHDVARVWLALTFWPASRSRMWRFHWPGRKAGYFRSPGVSRRDWAA